MTIQEAYDEWVKTANIEYRCSHGELSGMCGYYGFARCSLDTHPSVHYGGNICPNNCPDFKESYENSYSAFMLLYHAFPDYYNKQYDIDKNSSGYLPGYEEQKEMVLQRNAEYGEELKQRFDSAGLWDIKPEIEEDFTD